MVRTTATALSLLAAPCAAEPLRLPPDGEAIWGFGALQRRGMLLEQLPPGEQAFLSCVLYHQDRPIGPRYEVLIERHEDRRYRTVVRSMGVPDAPAE